MLSYDYSFFFVYNWILVDDEIVLSEYDVICFYNVFNLSISFFIVDGLVVLFSWLEVVIDEVMVVIGYIFRNNW